MKSCSILISSWCGHKAMELCIESILERTDYKTYQIIVCDSSSPFGPDRKYLRNHKEKGNIKLLESEVRLQHGQALWRLLSYCKTDLACILDSDSEILSSDWLDVFTSQIKNYEKDLGIGYLIKGGNRPNNDFFFAPVFHPSLFVLNMSLYRQIMKEDDWMFAKIDMKDFRYKKELQAMNDEQASHWFEYDRFLNRPSIAYDSGGIFTERMIYENPRGLKMHAMPLNFFGDKVRHFGGMSAYHTRLDHPHMKHKYELLKERLQILRGESK